MQTASFYYEFIRSPEGYDQFSVDHNRLLSNALHEATEKYLKKIRPLWKDVQPSNRSLLNISHQRQIKAAHQYESRIALIEECLSACLYLDLKKTVDPTHQDLLENYVSAALVKKPEEVKSLKERVNNLELFQGWLKETEGRTGKGIIPQIAPSPSRLDQIELKAMKWSEGVKTLPVHPESSYNTLYLLFKHKSYRGIPFTSQKPVAFLKGGTVTSLTSREALLTPHMETLMYQVAAKLGLSPYFAETKLAAIQTKTACFSGSIQRRIRGVQLGQLFDLELEKEISMPAFITGFFISYLFGTTDGRLPNYFYDKSKKRLIHFDNSRSLPHSNRCIKKWEQVLLTFRCHLLQLIQSMEAIPAKSKAATLQTLSDIEPLLGTVRELLQRRAVEERWPLSWVDPQRIMHAMVERIENLKTHLPKTETLWDFMLAAEPEWAFVSSLRLLIQLCNTEGANIESLLSNQEPLLEDIKRLVSYACCGEEFIMNLFLKAENCQIDPGAVKVICEEKKQLLPWISSLCKYYDQSLREKEKGSASSLGQHYATLYRELEKNAAIDDKDVRSDRAAEPTLLNSTTHSS